MRDNEKDVLRSQLFNQWLTSKEGNDVVCFACSKEICQDDELLKQKSVVTANGHVQDAIEFSDNVKLNGE